MTNKSKLQNSNLNRARSLAERMDQQPELWVQRELGCKLHCRATGQKLHWPVPIFTRLAIDLSDPTPLLATIESLKKKSGISIVQPDLNSSQGMPDRMGSGADRSMDDGLSIQPIFIDEPIRFERLMHAEQIELQFVSAGSKSNRGAHSSGYLAQRWMPTLPSDLTDVDKFGKRIDLLRSASDQATVIVGGSIAAGAVYDDVRFLIDSGVDYVNVLGQVVAGLKPAKTYCLQPIDWVIEQARAAIDKSGVSDISLFVSSDIDSVEDGLRLLSCGVDAFCMDSWLIKHQTETASSAQASDDLSSFMGSYTRAASTAPVDGMLKAALAFVEELNSFRRVFEI
ncbi:MAG: hypothetical protein ACKOOI_07140 [Pirellula sp.]